MTPPLLDIDALLLPLAGDNPAGRSVPFEIRQKLDDARKEVDPSSFPANDPMRPKDYIRADWPLIVKLAQQVLSTTSKDLLVAARLTEALTKHHGFAGARDGLTLARRMVDEAWDRILPVIEEEDDIEARGSAFFWLDEPDRGARFPSTLRLVPLVRSEQHAFGWMDWHRLQSEKEETAREEFDKAVQQTTREASQDVVDDLKGAVETLNDLTGVLNTRMGALAPGLVGLREAFRDCLALAEQILAKKGPGPAPLEADPAYETAVAAGGPAVPAAGPGAPPSPAGPPSREQLYRQIAQAAAALRKLEPHSPIPYLLERAVALGELPFPDLMKALVRDAQVLAGMSRELGIKGLEE